MVDEWIDTKTAATITGYRENHIRGLARKGQIVARKVLRDWLINSESLLTYQREMQALGRAKHDPRRRQA